MVRLEKDDRLIFYYDPKKHRRIVSLVKKAKEAGMLTSNEWAGELPFVRVYRGHICILTLSVLRNTARWLNANFDLLISREKLRLISKNKSLRPEVNAFGDRLK